MRLPGLHSIHWKVFVFHLAVLVLPLAYISSKVRSSIETSYLHSTEEGMIDTAAVVSELYARLYGQFGADSEKVAAELSRVYSNLNETYEIKARLFGFTRAEVDTRLLVYDPAGRVIFDTKGTATNQDFSKLEDVRQALNGRYGSRWELDKAHQRVNIYSTLPVFVGDKTVGAVSVSKSTNRIRNFISRSLEGFILPALIALVLATAMAYVLSAYITRIIWDLASRAERVAAGESNVRLETWTRSELGTLARAVERMREKLEGKAYVEQMATNLSHELKTPLAAIRGSAELLEGPASNDAAARAKFLANIQSEVARLDRIVSEMLKLSRIEAQPPGTEIPAIDATQVANEIAEMYQRRATDLGLRFHGELADSELPIRIAEMQLKQLLTNLLDNAMQSRPPDAPSLSAVDEKKTLSNSRFATKEPGSNRNCCRRSSIVSSPPRIRGPEIAAPALGWRSRNPLRLRVAGRSPWKANWVAAADSRLRFLRPNESKLHRSFTRTSSCLHSPVRI